MAVLKNFTITTTGDLGRGKSSDNLRKWVEANGGRWLPNVTKDTTHLITSKESWRKGCAAVEKAKEVNAYIVNFDWLEDTLQSRRKKPEKKYRMDVVENGKKKERKTVKKMERLGKKGDRTKFEKGVDMAQQDIGSGTSLAHDLSLTTGFQFQNLKLSIGFFKSSLSALADMRKKREEKKMLVKQAAAAAEANSPAVMLAIPSPSPATPSNLYHLYLDSSGFEYKILLTRTDMSRNQITRYNLRLYESHTIPHVYCTFIQFIAPRISSTIREPTPPIIPGMAIANRVVDIKHDASIKPERKTKEDPDAKIFCPSPPKSKAPTSHPLPFKRLLAPPNSEYHLAFAVFRAAFEHLTLLPWEERQNPSLQRIRAEANGLEPFAYLRPQPGMPVGVFPQIAFEKIPHPFSDLPSKAAEIITELPGMDVKLSADSGGIGREIAAEARLKCRAEKKIEEKRIKEEFEEKKKESKRKTVKVELVDGVWVGKPAKAARSSFFDFER
ncbi:hypothetical protein GQ43DRAFT_470178 [Delitschia confertaspora ATCC 74209]|uniref:BRCT domain-containing protein n=1 Tax=Delitschia confertaspora ATCC 74209 TaxID=1513339 RepID=A0A9P4MU46_9PLEO|nr:hypothetical protein GQ43DRAFT_470178 [Delitschia confertaspora ATCC 74209]